MVGIGSACWQSRFLGSRIESLLRKDYLVNAFQEIRVWVMPDVVHSFCQVQRDPVLIFDGNLFENALHDFQNTEAVRKSGVGGVGVDEVTHLQLLQFPQSLERWCVDDLPLKGVWANIPVNAIDYYFYLI